MSDHEQTLRKLGTNYLRGLQIYTSAPEELRASCEGIAAACLSGADALVRDKQTCGNCAFWEPAWPAINPNRGVCQNHKAAACDSEIAADDGCRKGWATRED